MILLDGKQTSEKLISKLKASVAEKLGKGSRKPRLDIILVGDNFGSKKYVEMKKRKAEEIGIYAVVHEYEDSVSEKELVNQIDILNADDTVDGVMVQLPLPKHVSQNTLFERINPEKDVDGLTSINLGKLFKGDSTSIPSATPRGVVELLKEYSIDVDGMNAVVVGRSDIVGLPLVAMLNNENATVTLCHSHTKDLKNICKSADLLLVAIGKAEYINSEYVKEGSTVIDVGFNKNAKGELVGDVDFEDIKDTAEYITPVPGGVGPMTIASLLLNLVEIYERNVKKE